MTLPSVPEWLARREGSLQSGVNSHILFVMLGGQPQYRLDARPADGQISCAVIQTINGHRLDDGTTYPTVEAALAGGLDQLRNKLGW